MVLDSPHAHRRVLALVAMAAEAASGRRLCLLGPVEMSQDGAPVALGGPIARLLFVQLALAKGRVVPDDQAIDAVWGEFAPDSVATALRVHMTHLRRALRPLNCTIERRHYGFRLADDIATDVIQLGELEKRVLADNVADALVAADDALTLWRGPSLTDLRRFPLGERLAAGLDRRQDSMVDRRLELLVKSGRPRDTLPDLHRLVRESPLNESRWALLAEALYRAGHQAESLAALGQARSVLSREAGLSPGPALRELHRRILHHQLDDVAPASQSPARQRTNVPKALEVHAPSRLVGREEQLRYLTGRLDQLTGKAASVVVAIHGESGVGKSALAAHFARAAARHGLRVLYGWAEQNAVRPLGVWATPLSELLGSRPRFRTSAQGMALQRVLGWQEAAAEPAVQDPAETSASRARMIEAVRHAAGTDDPQGGLVIVLDDVQWADELSVDVVRSIARHPLTRPLVIVLTERTGRPPRVAGPGVTDIQLLPLGEADIATWCNRGCDTWTSGVLGLTGGLPLLIDDLVQRSPIGGDLPRPPSLAGRKLLQDRVAGLQSRAANLLVTAAVLGPSFQFEHLIAVSRQAELELIEDLDAAVQVGILNYDLTDASRFRFAHDMLRLAALQDVSPLRQQRLHADVLRAVQDLPGPVAAQHALDGGRFVAPETRASQVLRGAGELLATFGFAQARDLLAAALDRGGDVGAAARAALLTALARAEAALGEPQTARAHLREAYDAAAAADEPETLAEVLLAEGMFGPEQAQDKAASARLTALLTALPAPAVDTRFRVLRQLAFTHVYGGRLVEAADVLDQAHRLAAELASADAAASLLYVDYMRCEFAGESEARAELVVRAGHLLSTHDNPQVRARFLGMSVLERMQEGAVDAAELGAAELAELGRRTGDPYTEWMGLAAGFSPPFLAGDLTRAYAAAERAAARGGQSEIFGAASAHGGQLFALAWASGRRDAIRQPAEAPDLEGPQLAWHAARALALTLAGHTEAARGELTGAHRLIPVVGAHWIGFVGLTLAVEAAVMLQAENVLADAEPILRRRKLDHAILGLGALDLGPVARYLALARLGLGDRDEALALLADVQADPRSGRIWQLRAGYDLAALGSAPRDVHLPVGGGTPWAWLPLASALRPS